jgi:hypothetical protein
MLKSIQLKQAPCCLGSLHMKGIQLLQANATTAEMSRQFDRPCSVVNKESRLQPVRAGRFTFSANASTPCTAKQADQLPGAASI